MRETWSTYNGVKSKIQNFVFCYILDFKIVFYRNLEVDFMISIFFEIRGVLF